MKEAIRHIYINLLISVKFINRLISVLFWLVGSDLIFLTQNSTTVEEVVRHPWKCIVYRYYEGFWLLFAGQQIDVYEFRALMHSEEPDIAFEQRYNNYSKQNLEVLSLKFQLLEWLHGSRLHFFGQMRSPWCIRRTYITLGLHNGQTLAAAVRSILVIQLIKKRSIQLQVSILPIAPSEGGLTKVELHCIQPVNGSCPIGLFTPFV